MSPLKNPVIRTFNHEPTRRLVSRLRETTRFRSRARGDARPTSDFGMLVIVAEKTPEVRAQSLDSWIEIIDRYEALVASVLHSLDEWKRSRASSLARNIERRGQNCELPSRKRILIGRFPL